MKTTGHTIAEISRMVGYQNQFNFSRAFKRLIGQSPRERRNGNKLR
jgi:AraC-like DNA-binding protein